ncbi:MAG: circadian clock KaiB family protein [Desulfosalsimonadaceae bacterium]
MTALDKNNPFQERASWGQPPRFILFVVGNEPNSLQARQNMKHLCERIDGPVEYEVIDVLDNFQTALQYNILATPALVRINPEPQLTILGNLSDTKRILALLHYKGPAR